MVTKRKTTNLFSIEEWLNESSSLHEILLFSTLDRVIGSGYYLEARILELLRKEYFLKRSIYIHDWVKMSRFLEGYVFDERDKLTTHWRAFARLLREGILAGFREDAAVKYKEYDKLAS